jgi:hypothetical protein
LLFREKENNVVKNVFFYTSIFSQKFDLTSHGFVWASIKVHILWLPFPTYSLLAAFPIWKYVCFDSKNNWTIYTKTATMVLSEYFCYCGKHSTTTVLGRIFITITKIHSKKKLTHFATKSSEIIISSRTAGSTLQKR